MPEDQLPFASETIGVCVPCCNRAILVRNNIPSGAVVGGLTASSLSYQNVAGLGLEGSNWPIWCDGLRKPTADP